MQWVDGVEVEDAVETSEAHIALIHRGLLRDDWPPFLPLTLEQEESVHYAPDAPGGKHE